MILANYYYYFKGALSPKFCDDVIAYGNKSKSRWVLQVKLKRDFKNHLLQKEMLDLKNKRF